MFSLLRLKGPVALSLGGDHFTLSVNAEKREAFDQCSPLSCALLRTTSRTAGQKKCRAAQTQDIELHPVFVCDRINIYISLVSMQQTKTNLTLQD
jgi:hypothetical protein